MNKKIIFASIVFAFIVILPTHISYAQSDETQKALENVKESINSLVNAKDENSPDEKAFRVEALKKIVDFSIAETKELKVKFISEFADAETGTSTMDMWQGSVLDRITKVLSYLETGKKALSAEQSLEEIKNQAESFKKWREETYIPLSDEINSFLIIQKQKKSLVIAETRTSKIEKDMAKIEKLFSAKKVQPLKALIAKAKKYISDANQSHNEASSLFDEKYVLIFEKENINTSSSTDVLVDEDEPEEENLIESATSSSATAIQTPSIKDLIGDSLTSVRSAYQTFIEMSNLVRKLLE